VDRITPALPKVSRPLDRAGNRPTEFPFWQKVRDWGRGLGLNEVINYSFVGQKDLDHLNLPEEGRIAVMNPLSADQNVLRTELASGLLLSLRHNLSQGHTGLRLFELAHVFHADARSETTVRESGRLGLLMYGDRFDSAWPQLPADAGYADLRGIVEHLLAFLHVAPGRFSRPDEEHPWLQPAVTVTVDGICLGRLGRVRPDLADPFHARKNVWMAELDLDTMRSLHEAVHIRFRHLPVYPVARRDITLAVPFSLPAEAVPDAVRAMKIPVLEEIRLLDVYLPDGAVERKLTYRMTFRHEKRTLEDAEVDKQRDAVAQYLPTVLPVRV
jgi:phenylalanyl-tRNA synthetase beta chain